MQRHFRDRAEAGRLLASKLKSYAKKSDVLVLGLPRGGVPVAFEIAKTLNAPLDIWLVRKLGVPGNKELAMGAIGMGDVRVMNKEIVKSLKVSDEAIARVVDQEKQELERRDRAYRGDRPIPDPRDRAIILVDDGIATGSTLFAALTSLRQHHPASIAVATPIIPPSLCKKLRREVDKVAYLLQPDPFHFIGFWYDDFSSTPDRVVCDLLDRSVSLTSIP
ncbi:phosphoribosyltransferase [Lusitaniella coriacea LEGE 07157]|uniref:Phosphoribosyltransferase n=1 Tax=Lusitaniella coriacea LEGE 07157 TaxID=945747 RepID=A0A8J7J2Q3_9CYAN|nr:phosphoribosyltransferase [Lusitaniella coriacea]MBE9116494.1 phosphoribosyltransferase [Lusitaniella coriacea LEGE 07157]